MDMHWTQTQRNLPLLTVALVAPRGPTTVGAVPPVAPLGDAFFPIRRVIGRQELWVEDAPVSPLAPPRAGRSSARERGKRCDKFPNLPQGNHSLAVFCHRSSQNVTATVTAAPGRVRTVDP